MRCKWKNKGYKNIWRCNTNFSLMQPIRCQQLRLTLRQLWRMTRDHCAPDLTLMTALINMYCLLAMLIVSISLGKLVLSTNQLNGSFVDLEQVKQHLNNRMNINSQFTSSLAQDVTSPRELFAMTLYSPASSAEHLRRKKTKCS